jgi:hypothetical protein
MFLKWPDSLRRAKILAVMKNKGFKGCVGFVDGTTFPIFQRPGKDGEVFFNRKKRYLLNAQVICDCNKYITAFITGWPGSCADSFVFKKMRLHNQPADFFDQGRSSAYHALMTPTDLFECV